MSALWPVFQSEHAVEVARPALPRGWLWEWTEEEWTQVCRYRKKEQESQKFFEGAEEMRDTS